MRIQIAIDIGEDPQDDREQVQYIGWLAVEDAASIVLHAPRSDTYKVRDLNGNTVGDATVTFDCAKED